MKNFCVATVKKERTTPNPPKTAPLGRPTLMANAGIEALPVIVADVIKPASTMRVAVFNRFFFLASDLRASISSRKNASISVNFLIDMFVVLVVLKGLNLGKFWFHCRIYSLLFNSWRQNVLGITSLLFSSSILKSRWFRCVSIPKNTKCIGEKFAL